MQKTLTAGSPGLAVVHRSFLTRLPVIFSRYQRSFALFIPPDGLLRLSHLFSLHLISCFRRLSSVRRLVSFGSVASGISSGVMAFSFLA